MTHTDLDNEGDTHGQSIDWNAENVEQRHGNKGFAGVKVILSR